MTAGDKDAGRGGKARTWNGRYVNIAHRRTPSELTPLIQQNLALQQQVELLTAQNQHMMHQHMSTAQTMPSTSSASTGIRAPPQPTSLVKGPGSTGYGNPSQLLPPPPHVFGHQRGSSSSAIPMGTPASHSRQRSMGHVRRHSLAVSEAKRAAQERSSTTATANSPAQASISNEADHSGSSSGPGNPPPGSFGSPGPMLDSLPQFRFPPSPDRAPADRPNRGHARSQSMSSSYRRQTSSPQPFQFPPVDNGSPAGSSVAQQPHNYQQPYQHNYPASQHNYQPGYQSPQHYHPHGHTRRSSAWQSESGQPQHGHRSRPSNASDFSPNQQQGRKSLFVPYLPQSMIPEMLADGLLVTGTLRVNHKNRSYAYVSTDLLDADVFIAGSKDRNRALEGDLVAVELLDVNDVWEQKREKEERKRRRGVDSGDDRLVETHEGQLRRRGSLKQREPQKRNDDIEVEGQTLLLREEVGNGEEKPLYSGHVVAILERPAGQLFSGTLGLLRPSSQANKERQHQHTRTASTSSFITSDDMTPTSGTSPTFNFGGNSSNNNGNNNNNSSNNGNNSNSKPKIVWFKPVDKCVPLMAIPTEQAPPDLIDNPQAYANQVFVAQIKRWPITSLHPFGMLVEKLGTFGDPTVSQTAVLRDFNFGSYKFGEPAIREAIDAGIAMEKAAAALPVNNSATHGGSEVTMLTQDMAASIYTDRQQNESVLAVHILDITPFVERGSSLDRALRHKSSSVYMEGFESPLISSQEALEAVSLKVGRKSPVITVEFHLETGAITVDRQAVTPHDSTVNDLNEDVLTKFAPAASALRRKRGLGSIDDNALDLSALLDVVVPARAPLSNPSRNEIIVTEIMHAVNAGIASELLRSTTIGLNALVRRQSEPTVARLEQFTKLLKLQGVRVDTTSAHTLARSLADQLSPRQAMAIKASLAKILGRQRYAVAARTNPGQLGHYWFGVDAYTHFCRPLLRYSDHIVARQVHVMLGTQDNQTSGSLTLPTLAPSGIVSGAPGGTATDVVGSSSGSAPSTPVLGSSGSPNPATSESSFSNPATSNSDPLHNSTGSGSLGSPMPVSGSSDKPEDQFGACALAPELSFRYDCAHGAQEQSFHLSLSRKLTDSYQLYSGVVTAVYESAFDVVIPELSVEKRVHGDQLPLVKAEFHPASHLLELFWKPDGARLLFTPDTGGIELNAATSSTPGLTVSSTSSSAAKVTGETTNNLAATETAGEEQAVATQISNEMRSKLKLRPEERVQEIRPLSEVPVLIRVVAQDRVLPSIVVLSAYPFSS